MEVMAREGYIGTSSENVQVTLSELTNHTAVV